MDISNYFTKAALVEVPQDEGEPTMGIQSQRRNNSTQSIRNRPSHQLQHPPREGTHQTQRTVDGGKVFDPDKDCPICRAEKEGVTKPKRAHHDRCPKKRANKAKLNPPSKQLMEYYENKNKKPLNKSEKWVLPQPQRDGQLLDGNFPISAPDKKKDKLVAKLSLSGVKQASNQAPTMSTSVGENSIAIAQCDGRENVVSAKDSTMDAATLRKALDEKMIGGSSPKKPHPLKQKMVPECTLLMVQYIQQHFPTGFKSGSNELPSTERAKEALEWYKRHFPNGTATFTFPGDDKSKRPSPFYHSIEGTSIVFLNWELMAPNIKLCCTKEECSGCLIRTRSDFSKCQKLHPIIHFTGNITWAVIMNYQCNECGECVSANNGKLLQSLPSHIRQEYPVDPRFAQDKDFHFLQDFSDWIPELMITDASGDKIAHSVVKKQGSLYQRRLDSYFDWCSYTGVTDALEYPSFHEWSGRYCPAGEHLRDLYNSTVRSPLTICGIADFERCTREIQSVTCKTIMSQDHTMEIVKNYPRSLGASAVWDAANENGEICCLALVDSTAASEYSHAAECLARRPNFLPRVMYSDIWPNGRELWEILFGDGLVGRLGLFHFNKRIISTLRPSHPDYRRAISDLRRCIYRYDEVSEGNVIKALKNGTLGGEKLDDEQVQSLRDSRRWKTLCDPYLRKIIFTGDIIRMNLTEWFIDYKVDASPGEAQGRGRPNPINGQKLFTPDTKSAVEECKKTCEFLHDVLPPEQMYRSANAPATSKHGLETQNSNRGESRLESFHGVSADFANTNMRASLADALTIEGTAEGNADVRERIKFETMDPDKKKLTPVWLHGKCIMYNDSNKAALNKKAAAVGAPQPFSNVRVLQEDTGERFLSEYLMEQRQRKKQFGYHRENSRCLCLCCGNSKIPLPHQVVWNPYTNSYTLKSSTDTAVDEPDFAEMLVDELVQGPQQPVTQEPSVLNIDAPIGMEPNALPALAPNGTLPSAHGMPALQLSVCSLPQQCQPTVAHFAPAYQQLVPIPAWSPVYFHQQQPLTQPEVVHAASRKRRKLEVEYCCIRMQNWSLLNKRMGRMPHDESCPKREKNRATFKRQKKHKK